MTNLKHFHHNFPHPAGVDVIAVFQDPFAVKILQDNPVAIVRQNVAVPVELRRCPPLGLALGSPGNDMPRVQAIEAVIFGFEFALKARAPHKVDKLGDGFPGTFEFQG